MTKNYYKINWMLGPEYSFRTFVESAHANGIRVVLDLVVNHTWSEHPFMLDVLDGKSNSPYAEWYQWRGAPGESSFVYYYDWTMLPNLNVDNPEVQEYMARVAEYWLINYDIDGYRCDVAWGVEQDSDSFWLYLTNRLKNIKPEVFLLAETPAANSGWEFTPSTQHNKSILFDSRFASAYDWSLRPWAQDQGIVGALNGSRSITQLNSILADVYPPRALPLRFIENHGLPRAPSILDHERSKLGHTLIFTVPGIPLIYGGAEHGQTERMEGLIRNDLYGVKDYFTQLINARKKYIDNDSTFEILPSSNSYRVNSYATISDDSIAVSTLNFRSQSVTVRVDLSSARDQLSAYEERVDVFGTTSADIADDLDTLTVTLGPYEAYVLIFTNADADAAMADESAQSPAVVAVPDPSYNLLRNGDFASGFSGWTSYIHSAGGAAAQLVPSAGKLDVVISQQGTEVWHIQLIQQGIELIQGETYEVEFTASAERRRSIIVGLTRDGGDFRSYGNQAFTISTEPATYRFSFEMSAVTDGSARFVVEMGTSDIDLTFFDFVLNAD